MKKRLTLRGGKCQKLFFLALLFIAPFGGCHWIFDSGTIHMDAKRKFLNEGGVLIDYLQGEWFQPHETGAILQTGHCDILSSFPATFVLKNVALIETNEWNVTKGRVKYYLDSYRAPTEIYFLIDFLENENSNLQKTIFPAINIAIHLVPQKRGFHLEMKDFSGKTVILERKEEWNESWEDFLENASFLIK